MLVSHAAFLAQVSLEAAERLTAEFEKTANSLEIMPQRCPWLSGEYIPKNAYRFILFEKRYMIIFQIIDDTVYGLCGGLQAGLRMAHPLTTEYQKRIIRDSDALILFILNRVFYKTSGIGNNNIYD